MASAGKTEQRMGRVSVSVCSCTFSTLRSVDFVHLYVITDHRSGLYWPCSAVHCYGCGVETLRHHPRHSFIDLFVRQQPILSSGRLSGRHIVTKFENTLKWQALLEK